MENIIIGCRRNKGVITDEKTGKKTSFDSISIYAAEFRELGGQGFQTSAKGANVVKVRTNEFYEVVGIKPKLFLEKFEEKFMFHKVRVLFEKNKFGREEVSSVKISKKDCYTLWQEEQDALADLDDEDEDELDDSDEALEAAFADEEPESDFDELDNEEFDVDTSTGEVKETEPPAKKSGASKK